VIWVVCAVLAVGAIGFTLYVRERDIPPLPVENPELRHLERRRQILYDNLKDLQFEYHQGKLSDEDYQALKAGFLGDLAGIMDAIERLETSTARPERQRSAEGKPRVKIQPAQPAATNICPSCQAENPPDHRFCGKCGKGLAS
jgi:ribosomal protein L40E